jgi:ribosomal protein S18 acetylase RimI-like enzyme
MASRIELIPYDPAYVLHTAQAFVDVFTMSPWSEAISLNDVRTQLESDYRRVGFGGLLLHSTLEDSVAGFSWWFDSSGQELYDRWRPRFVPKEKVPKPEGRGVYLIEFGVTPMLQHHGLGQRLLKATLAEIEPTHDWIAVDTHRFAHAGLALLKSNAFEELGLSGSQVPTRVCLMKTIRR